MLFALQNCNKTFAFPNKKRMKFTFLVIMDKFPLKILLFVNKNVDFMYFLFLHSYFIVRE